jgi:mono/diheme cytochrome c family protein
MYESPSYETYVGYDTDVFEGGQEAKLPVEGTVSRGWMPYDYENTTEGLAKAKAELKNPIPYTEDNLNKGKELYTIYCAICHGDKGDGKGTLAEREKILGIPAYNDQGRAITEGSVYHVMYYGLNTMGSYASQTDEEERWQIDHYVMDLKAQLDGQAKREFVTTDMDNEAYMTKDISSRNMNSQANEELMMDNEDSETKTEDEINTEMSENDNSLDEETSEMNNSEE